MQKVNVKDIAKYEGKILARDVFYNGKLLFQSNYTIDKSFISRISELKENIFYVFLYKDNNELNDDLTDLINKEIMDTIKVESDLIFHRYSYTNEDDTELIKKIVDIFINDILKEKYFKNYLENLLIVNHKVFHHSVRVTIIALILAIKANLNKELIYGIAIGSILHEIGRNKLFIEFPVLASTSHIYNQEEYHLIQMVPILGYNEVLNNSLVPLISKKIILLQNVWEDFEASYDKNKKMHMSHPTFYEDKKITSEQKDIAVNIVQAANYFDMFLIKFKHDFPSIGGDINAFFIKNSEKIFNKDVLDLLTKHISYFAIGEKVMLSNGKTGLIERQTNEQMKPVVKLEDNTILNLAECKQQLYIKNIIASKGSDVKVDKKFKKHCNNV